MREPPGHGRKTVEKLESLGDVVRLKVTPGQRHMERRASLLDTAGGDAEVMEPVAA
jgi:transposase